MRAFPLPSSSPAVVPSGPSACDAPLPSAALAPSHTPFPSLSHPPAQALLQNNPANARRLLGIDHVDFKAVMNRWAKPLAEGGDQWIHPVLGVEARALRLVPTTLTPLPTPQPARRRKRQQHRNLGLWLTDLPRPLSPQSTKLRELRVPALCLFTWNQDREEDAMHTVETMQAVVECLAGAYPVVLTPQTGQAQPARRAPQNQKTGAKKYDEEIGQWLMGCATGACAQAGQGGAATAIAGAASAAATLLLGLICAVVIVFGDVRGVGLTDPAVSSAPAPQAAEAARVGDAAAEGSGSRRGGRSGPQDNRREGYDSAQGAGSAGPFAPAA